MRIDHQIGIYNEVFYKLEDSLRIQRVNEIQTKNTDLKRLGELAEKEQNMRYFKAKNDCVERTFNVVKHMLIDCKKNIDSTNIFLYICFRKNKI